MLRALENGTTAQPARSLRLFLLIAFSGAWILFLLPLAFGSPGDQTRSAVALVTWSAAMWAPGLAAIYVTRKVDGGNISDLGMGKFGDWRVSLWAWLAPPALTLVSGALTVILGVGKLDTSLAMLQSAAPSSSVSLAPNMILLFQALSGLTIGALFNTVFALGEELGWRGYLFPKLLPLGQIRAILLTGLVWGIWHWPVILQGRNYPGHPILGLFLMIGFCILFGAFLCWLYLRTGSVWAPAFCHATLNAFAGFPILFMPKVDLAIGGPITSLVGWIPMLALLGWMVWKRLIPVSEPAWVSEPEE